MASAISPAVSRDISYRCRILDTFFIARALLCAAVNHIISGLALCHSPKWPVTVWAFVAGSIAGRDGAVIGVEARLYKLELAFRATPQAWYVNQLF